jgi:hypothetical protein
MGILHHKTGNIWLSVTMNIGLSCLFQTLLSTIKQSPDECENIILYGNKLEIKSG